MRRRQLQGTAWKRPNPAKSGGSSTGSPTNRSSVVVRIDRDGVVNPSSGSTQLSHCDVANRTESSWVGLATPVAYSGTRASKPSTPGQRASDALNRHGQGVGGPINSRASVLVREVPHEDWDAGETTAPALAAPLEAVTKGPLETARRRCARVRMGHCAQTVEAGMPPKPAQALVAGCRDTTAQARERGLGGGGCNDLWCVSPAAWKEPRGETRGAGLSRSRGV